MEWQEQEDVRSDVREHGGGVHDLDAHHLPQVGVEEGVVRASDDHQHAFARMLGDHPLDLRDHVEVAGFVEGHPGRADILGRGPAQQFVPVQVDPIVGPFFLVDESVQREKGAGLGADFWREKVRRTVG